MAKQIAEERYNDPSVQESLLRKAALMLRTTARTAPLSTVLFVGLLWTHADHGHLILWLAVALSLATCGLVITEWTLRSPDFETLQYRARFLTPYFGITGVVWASLTIFAMPTDPLWEGTMGTMMLGVLVVPVLFGAPDRRSFWAYQVCAGVTVVIGFSLLNTTWGFAMAAFFAYAVPFSGVLVRIGRAVDVDAAYYASQAETLVVELKDLNSGLTHRATHDALTGLANRHGFMTALKEELELLDRGGSDCAVVFLDLDHFKTVNDSLGHASGDRLLREVGERLRRSLRSNDLLARFGGDEFTVLVRGTESLEQAEAVARRICRSLEEPLTFDGRTLEVTASLGVASTHSGGLVADDLLRLADVALYQAKDQGRARVAIFDVSQRDLVDSKLDAKADFEAALIDGRIRAWYQPLIDLQTGDIVGAEALARWVESGVVRPAYEFMDLADEFGLGGPISVTVGRSVKGLHHQFASEGRDLQLGTNVDPSAIAQVLAVFDGIDLAGLTIEITERGVITDLDAAKAMLTEVKRRGGSVALDDFGTGQSALAVITQLPIDTIKLDRQFIGEMEGNRKGSALVRGVTQLAKELGAVVVAEGIETRSQAAMLREFGVDIGQGFLFSKAVPPEDFVRLVQAGHNYRTLLSTPAVPRNSAIA